MVLPSSSTRSSSRPTCSSIKLTAASAIKPPTERQKCQRTDNSKPSAEFSFEAKMRRNSRFIVLWQQRTISVAQEGDRRRLERTERRDTTAVRDGRPRRRGAVALRVGAGGAEADRLVAPNHVKYMQLYIPLYILSYIYYRIYYRNIYIMHAIIYTSRYMLYY